MALLAALAVLGLARAQSIAPEEIHAQTVPYVPPSPVRLRTEVDVVEVPVVVRDGQHRAVAGLTRNDFEIYDTGVRQTITAFSEQHFTSQVDAGGGANPVFVLEAPAGRKGESRPRFVALCFDDLNSEARDLKSAREAAERFVRTDLAPGDRVAVVTVTQSQDYEFTGDVPKLVERIAKVTSHQRSNDRVAIDDSVRSEAGWRHLQNNLQDALALITLRTIGSLVDGLAKLPGQRMILLASAGFLTGNVGIEQDLLMAKALHAEVVINTLDAKGLYTLIPGGDASTSPAVTRLPPSAQVEDAKAIEAAKNAQRVTDARDAAMAILAAGTGGTFYHNNNDLARGFRELGMVPETMYVLSFSPSGVAADGRFHSLQVRLAAGNRYSLQARLGYAASPANAAAPGSPPSKLDSEAMASDTVTDLPVRFAWEQSAGPPGITMVAHLDLTRLHFETRQGRRGQKLTLVWVLRDSRGAFVTGKQSELDLNLTDATFAQLAKAGTSVSVTLEAPPGSYAVRGVVEDALDGKLTAAGAAVEVKAPVAPPPEAHLPK